MKQKDGPDKSKNLGLVEISKVTQPDHYTLLDGDGQGKSNGRDDRSIKLDLWQPENAYSCAKIDPIQYMCVNLTH